MGEKEPRAGIQVLSLTGFVHSRIISVNKYLLSTHCVPNPVLGAWDTHVCKTGIILPSQSSQDGGAAEAAKPQAGGCTDQGPRAQGGLPTERRARQDTSLPCPPQFKGLRVMSAFLSAVRIKSDNVQNLLAHCLITRCSLSFSDPLVWVLSHFTEE